MKDSVYAIGFIALGLGLAFAFSGPLRHPKKAAVVGTPLVKEAPYAEGDVSMDPAAVKEAQTAPVLFVIVKAQEGGPPIAVKKYVHPRFPLAFSIGQADNMADREFYDGDILVIARLDQDGVAGPKQPGDLEGRVHIKRGEPRRVAIKVGGDGL